MPKLGKAFIVVGTWLIESARPTTMNKRVLSEQTAAVCLNMLKEMKSVSCVN